MTTTIYDFFSKFTISDWLTLIGIIASLITSIVAIWISIKTLNQNNQMIEESTRPYIVISGETTNYSEPKFYLMMKNHGSSGATITKFECNFDLSEFSHNINYKPFEHIVGTFVAPGQSFLTNLNKSKLFDKDRTLKFDIEYQSNNKVYSEHFEIVLKAYTELIQTRTATPNAEMKVISYALQDLVEKHL